MQRELRTAVRIHREPVRSSSFSLLLRHELDSLQLMYRWRKMSPEQRQETVARRKLQHHPQHSPRHHGDGKGLYLVTATCYEHHPWIGASDKRMDCFSAELLEVLANHTQRVDAWVVLPNHYHAVVLTESCPALLRELGKLHGRSSFLWNGEDAARGRKVWFNSLEREISGDAHHIASIHLRPSQSGEAWICEKVGRLELVERARVSGKTWAGRSGEKMEGIPVAEFRRRMG